ncbi:MAG: hypothetical protein J6X45_00500 [Lachnospiraceae bacterium]|nr:hypothetical protein [Lachnospiraceae bacterium]
MAIMSETSSLDNSFETREKREKEKEADKKVAPIVKQDQIVTVKKSFFARFKDSFFSEDARDIGDYILNDLIIPGIKDTVLSTIERAFGYSGDRYRRDRRDDREHTSYSSYYKSSSRRDEPRKRRMDIDEKVDYRNIILRNREDAEDIADKMNYYIHEYDSVSVAMLFDLIDMPGRYTDNNWGWTREGDIRVRRVRNGYLIDVPEAVYIGD